MTTFEFGVDARLVLPDKGEYGLQFAFRNGDGKTSLRIGPADQQAPMLLSDVVAAVADMLGLSDELGSVTKLAADEPWKSILSVGVDPFLTVEVAKAPSVQLLVRLYQNGTYGITLPPGDLPSWLTIEPRFTVYDLIVGYDQGNKKLDVRARVTFHEQQPALASGAVGDPTAGKSEVVSFPFPVPAKPSGNLRMHYFGLGQRFGPPVDPTADDPIKAMFDKLESTFTTNDPATLLPALAQYYAPDRDWFVALHVSARGWDIRAIFNDPAMYGLEITCSEGAFEGLLFEILYQKLGPSLGVYYGALTLPAKFRNIQLGVVAVTLPSFKIWIYTNGDFKVSVGWPLGPDSIGVQVYIFTGGCAFYFAKLRSGDNPEKGAALLAARGDPVAAEVYNPILEFGLGLWLGVGRSFSCGPFSASLSLTVRGVFQGVLAWQAPADDPSKSADIAHPPDYYWFAATVGIVGEMQGEVDLKVVKLSVLVRLSVQAAVAFETGYGSAIAVEARVDVEASLRILFITISVGFHTTISQTFQLTSSDKGNASVDGPRNPAFHGMNDWAVTGLDALAARRALAVAPMLLAADDVELPPAPATPAQVALRFLLQPSATYASTTGTPVAVATLVLTSPPPQLAARQAAGAEAASAAAGPPTDLETLVTALAGWLLRTWSGGTGRWSSVVAAIGEGRATPPAQWDTKLAGFLTTELAFTLHPVDLTVTQPEVATAFFPMFDELALTWTGHPTPVVFADASRTYDNYVHVVEQYFATLSLDADTSNPSPRGEARFGALSVPPPGAPTGPSLTRHTFDDYFLTLARELARALADTDDAGGMPGAALAANLGGLTSRYLLGGVRVPDPGTTPKAPPVDLYALDIGGAYALAHQQFDVDPAVKVCDATLAIGPDGGPLAAAIHFAGEGATSVTSKLPVAAAPPAPVPVWSGPDLAAAAAAATISVAAIPAATPYDVWYAQRTRLPLAAAGEPARFVVPLPADLLTEARTGPHALTVLREPPAASGNTPLAVSPVLFVPVTAHLVDRLRNASADAGDPDPVSPYVPHVYRLDGTDDETRDRIDALLANPSALDGATISILYDAPSTGYVSDALDLAKHPVVLAKTNLSTSSEPGFATELLRFSVPAAEDNGIGPVSAQPAAAQQFLRLLWEVSVVHTGGFYLRYATATGADLPTRIFTPPGQEARAGGLPASDSAPLVIAVTFPPKTKLAYWHNAFSVAAEGIGDGTLYLGVSDPNGPVRSLQPSYPPGCVGFSAEWRLPELLARAEGTLHDDQWIAALYHLLQYRVAGERPGTAPKFRASLWSLALTPTTDGAGAQDYRQVVPVYRYAGASAGSPYDAVGGTPSLEFRLDDVFGNPLDASAHSGSFAVRYNDPLLPPAEWPGVRTAYRFLPAGVPCTSGDTAAGPRLCVTLAFDPAAVVHSNDDAGKDEAATALARYRVVAAQLADPRTSLSLTASVLPAGPVADTAALRTALASFAESVAAQLKRVVDGQWPASPVSTALAFPVDPKGLAACTDDIVMVQVTLALTRPSALVYTDPSGRTVPRSDTATMVVVADLDPPAGGTERARARAALGDGPAPIDVGLTTWATQFEQVFAGFDGAGGAARVAVRSDVPDFSAPPGPPAIWAIRWSATAGVTAAFDTEHAAYFSMAPLSVDLFGGPAQVPSYDSRLAATYTTQTFTGVDLDGWARTALDAMDRVLAPDVATAVAAADPVTYAKLMQAKSVVAQALAAGVVPVYVLDKAATDAGIIAGDLTVARDEFEQATLVTLASAYTVSSVVQVPASVTVSGTVEGAYGARLFGAVGPVDGAPPMESDVTVTNGRLPLRATTKDDPEYLTFLVSVGDPRRVPDVVLPLAYRVRFVEHRIDEGDVEYGYAPSQWLRLALHQEHDVFDFALGTVDAPVPSRDYPALPVLRSQEAVQEQPSENAHGIADYLKWAYQVDLVLPDAEAQDALWVDVQYNVTPRGMLAEGLDPLVGLYQALASFVTAWAALAPYVAGLPDGGGTVPASAVIGAVWDQVRPLAAAWATLRGIPVPPGWAPPDVLRDSAFGLPVVQTDHYVVDFSDQSRGILTVLAQAPLVDGKCAPLALRWPLVNGVTPKLPATPVCSGTDPCAGSPTPEPCWYSAEYTYAAPPPGSPAPLTLRWTPLDVLALQTAQSSYRIVRNADLSSGRGIQTNPVFVYRTPTVAFGTPVVPLVAVPKVGPLAPDPKSLARSMCTTLAPLAEAGVDVSAQRLLRVAIRYSYALAGGDGIRADTAVLLADNIAIAPGGSCDDLGSPGDATPTLAAVCKRLADNVVTWWEYARPSADEARIELAVVLFADVAGSRLPVIRLDDVQITAAAQWWPAS